MLAVLLPPSEGKAPGGDGRPWRPGSGRFGRSLRRQRLAVVEALLDAGGGDGRLLGVRGAALERARTANRSLTTSPTLPAWRRYTGVVWEHLDIAGLDEPARARAADAVVVVSALAGLAGLDDPLPDHRLKLSVPLAGLGRVDRFWRGPLSAALDAHLAGRLVVDLLPQEHAAAWSPDPSRYDLRRVRLVSPDGRTAGHAAKAAKGLLARSLLEADDPERALATFHHTGLHPQVEVVRAAVPPTGAR